MNNDGSTLVAVCLGCRVYSSEVEDVGSVCLNACVTPSSETQAGNGRFRRLVKRRVYICRWCGDYNWFSGRLEYDGHRAIAHE